MLPTVASRSEGDVDLALLLWRFHEPRWIASTGDVGGGVGERSWVLNAQVPHDYRRRDLDAHANELAETFALDGRGVCLFTAAAVRQVHHAHDDGVDAHATVGLALPTWAASPDDDAIVPASAGTINVVVFLPVRLSDGGLLNLLTTATEAKAQALFDAGIAATGTASDALCVVFPTPASPERFGGPRSFWGARVARAVHHAVLAGASERS